MITPTEFMIALVILLCTGFVIGYSTRIIHEIIVEEDKAKHPEKQILTKEEKKEEDNEESNR